jgi:hypothetical protein
VISKGLPNTSTGSLNDHVIGTFRFPPHCSTTNLLDPAEVRISQHHSFCPERDRATVRKSAKLFTRFRTWSYFSRLLCKPVETARSAFFRPTETAALSPA